MKKIALKLLSNSDLTLFEHQFRTLDVGNQKAINLNADVFIGRLFPAVPEMAPAQGGEFPVALLIYGPGQETPLKIRRTITRASASYKNWRLDGEFVPESLDAGRFHDLAAKDVAVLEFRGEPAPHTVRMFLVSKATAEDADLLKRLHSMLAGRSMAQVSEDHLTEVIQELGLPDEHPLRFLSDAADVEEAAQGNLRARRRLAARDVSREDLKEARRRAEEAGELAEALVNDYLDAQVNAGAIERFEWSSRVNAVAPYDFVAYEPGGQAVRIEVKGTTGEFSRPIHISQAELIEMAEVAGRTDIYRVYQAAEDGGRLRVSRDVREFARGVLTALEGLPDGVTCDSVSVRPDTVPFEDEIVIVPRDEE